MRATLAGARIVIPFAVAVLLIVTAGAGMAQADAQASVQPAVQAPAVTTPAPTPAPSGVERVLGELTPPIIAALLLLLAIAFSLALFVEISRGGSVAIESSWGGFGGGLGGWRLSAGLVYLLAVLFFGAMSMGVLQLVAWSTTGDATREAAAKAASPAPAPQPATPAAGTTAAAGAAPGSGTPAK